ncbi:MAG: hypothetical protein SGPRY_013365, partial [Prymnesium sp.]
ARVVITTAGPFEKYGQNLVRMCAEEGVHYADITGETDFFRKMIGECDSIAAKTGAKIVMHCGNDCVPWDLTVFEMAKFAERKGCELVEVSTYTQLPESATASGGTLATAIYQLGKARGAGKPDFDPLLRSRDGTKSECVTQITSPKQDVYVPDFKCNGGPWIMAPVMANCVRRSNALLGYHKNFKYGDLMLRGTPTWGQYLSNKAYTGLVASAVVLPSVFQRFLPGPGEGPPRETMEAGWLNVHAVGTIVDKMSGKQGTLESKYHFDGDCAYLNTARMLVESGLLLLSKDGVGGVMTPAAGLGSEIVERLQTEINATFELKEKENSA